MARKPPHITAEPQDRAARAIVEAGLLIDREPLWHRKLEDGTREKRFGRLPYVIVYEIPDETRPDAVNILSIWHTAQDRFGTERR